MDVQRVSLEAMERGKRRAGEVVREASPWVERLGRAGYVAKGIVYLVIGLLALQAAIGAGGKATDTKGALKTILDQPFGGLLLGVLAVGLVGYMLWRLVQAIADTEGKGTDAKGLVKRLGYALSGFVYGGLALTAFRLMNGSRDEGKGTTQDWTAWLLAQPFGQWLVAAAGLIVIGLGINALYIAYTARFCEKLRLDEMSVSEKSWATWIGRLGLTARGLVFGVIGIFLIQAAREADPNEARGLAGALKAMAQQPYGPWLLGAVGVGFMAYGIYMFFEARYRRMLLRA